MGGIRRTKPVRKHQSLTKNINYKHDKKVKPIHPEEDKTIIQNSRANGRLITDDKLCKNAGKNGVSPASLECAEANAAVKQTARRVGKGLGKTLDSAMT